MSEKKQMLNIDNLDKNRKRFSFKFTKFISFIINRKPKVVFTEEPLPDEPVIILSNHVARKAPSKFELYYPRDLRMWGTHEMTEGIKEVRKYLVHTYFYRKKHYPKFLAAIVGTLLSPLLNSFYKGARLIPTYDDVRFLTTIKYSLKAFFEGKDIVIFPEDSSNGYFDEIKHIFSGFLSLLDALARKGKDAIVYVTYYIKKKNVFVYSKRFLFSELKKQFETFDNIAEYLRIVMNSLSKI